MLASRRSTVAVLGLGAALPSPWAPAVLQRRAVAFRSVQRAPRTQVVVPGGRGPCLPRRTVTSRRPGRHASLRLRDRLRRRPSMSEADEAYNSASYRSQYINSFCSQKTRGHLHVAQTGPLRRTTRRRCRQADIGPCSASATPVRRGNGRELLMVIPGPATLLWL